MLLIRRGSVSVPGWVLVGASVDLDFRNGLYWPENVTSYLSCGRTLSGTDLLWSSASGFAYNTYSSNVLRITPGFGLLCESSREQWLTNSAAPATQTTPSLLSTGGTYTLWVNGSGSATVSAGTATISGGGSAMQGSPFSFDVTVAGTVVVTVAGSLNAFQLMQNFSTGGSSLIVTAGSVPILRPGDNVSALGLL